MAYNLTNNGKILHLFEEALSKVLDEDYYLLENFYEYRFTPCS